MRFPDVEALVRAFLAGKVTPPVSTKIPSPRPDTFVRVWRTGGVASSRVLERAQVTVQAWAPTTAAASELAGTCRDALLQEYTLMPLVRGVSESAGPYADPDPVTNLPRYSFTHILSVRAQR